MDVILSAAVVVLFLIAAAAAWPAMYAVWQRVVAGTARCISCHKAQACDEWLASGRREGADELCPNGLLLERMIATHRAKQR